MRKNIANFKELQVVVDLADGSSQVLSFEDVQAYALENKELELCPSLIKQGYAQVGSVTFTLTTRG